MTEVLPHWRTSVWRTPFSWTGLRQVQLVKSTFIGILLGKADFKRHLLLFRFRTQCNPIQKYWTALCTGDCNAMAKKITTEALVDRGRANERGANRLTEYISKMLFGSCMCRATWYQPHTAVAGAPQKPLVSNRWPSIWHGKKDIVGVCVCVCVCVCVGGWVRILVMNLCLVLRSVFTTFTNFIDVAFTTS